MSMVNDRVAKARASLPVIEEPETVDSATAIVEKYDCNYSENTAKVILKLVIDHPGITANSVSEILDTSDVLPTSVLKYLYDLGCVGRSFVRPRTYGYTFIRYPSFWTEQDVADTVYVPHPRQSKPSQLEKPRKKASIENAKSFFTEKPSRYEDMPAYSQFIADTTKFYGVRELDDLIGAIHEVCRQRIHSATARCVNCGKVLAREGSAVFCPQCQITINLGDDALSLKAYMDLAPQLLKAKQGVEE